MKSYDGTLLQSTLKWNKYYFKKMKHAYLIIAHNEPEILYRLIKILDRSENDIFVHIDKKSDINQFHHENDLCQNSHFYLIDKRMDVHWGGYSIVECEMNLMQSAYNKREYDFYHIISGVTLPIKNMQYIYEFFQHHREKIFLGVDVGDFEEEATRRIKYRNFFIDRNISMLGNRILQHLNGISLQKLFHLEKKSTKELKIGSQWCSLSNEAIRLLLSQRGWVNKTFRYGCCVDEIYKQTVIWNSPLRNKLYSVGKSLEGCMYEIDWNRGNGRSPYTFSTDSDVQLLLNSNKLFARKFSGQYIEMVDKMIALIHG